MNLHRVVCLSRKDPAASAHEVLTICHEFPSRNVQSGIGGVLLSFGEQYALLLEGRRAAVDRLIERVRRGAPEFEMAVRYREDGDQRAFRSWSINDLYRDEIVRDDPVAAVEFDNLIIDLLSGASAEAEQPFADLVAIAERRAPATSRVLAAAA